MDLEAQQNKWDELWLNVSKELELLGFMVIEGDFVGNGGIITIDFYTKPNDKYPLDLKEHIANRFRPEHNKKNREKVLDIFKNIGLVAKEFKITYYPSDNTLFTIDYYIECR